MSQRYGKYELLERIGSGGMAEVFKARLPGIAGFEKIVVIKRLHPHFSDDPGVMQMFVDEAKLAAGVQHKNVVQVYELDRLDNGELFIVMEWINGVDLKKLLRHAEASGARIPPWFSVYVVSEVLEALNHAYELVDERGRRRNVVHRDVSPENIFISQHGDVKLGDFGVARDDTRPDPFAKEAKGKLGYMAPEQLAGEQLDQRCDVFSAGVVLWECLTQHRLFCGETDPETMNLLLRGPRIAPSRIAHDLPEALDPIVLRTLHVDRARRTPSSSALQDELLAVLQKLRPNCGHVDVRTALRELLATEDQTVAQVTDELILSERDITDRAQVQVPEPAQTSGDLEDVWEDVEDSLPEPVDPSWDGTYAIINPRLKGRREVVREPAPRKSSDVVETDDLVRRRLVYEIPIAAKPSLSDTGDILREPPPREAIAVAPYHGAEPFYLRMMAAETFGPMSFNDLRSTLQTMIAAKRVLEMSGDGKRWMPLQRFMSLAEHDLFDDFPPSTGVLHGVLGAPSLIGLLGEIAEKHPSGKLTLIQGTGGRADIHISAGVPLHIATDVPELETSDLLVSCRVLDRDTMHACLHDVVRDEKPLSAAVAQRARIELNERRPKLLAARLEALLDWTGARYVYTPSMPIAQPPVARSVYSLLFEAVQRTRSVESLRGELWPLLGMRFDRSERFDRMAAHLGLPPNEIEGIGPFGFTRTLDEAIRISTGGERFAWSAAYVLLELGFLKARARVLT